MATELDSTNRRWEAFALEQEGIIQDNALALNRVLNGATGLPTSQAPAPIPPKKQSGPHNDP